MKAFLLAAVMLGAMTSVAVAEPEKLTDAEMSNIAAGFPDIPSVDVISNVNVDLPDVNVVTQVIESVQVINAFAGVSPFANGNATAAAAGQSDFANDLIHANGTTLAR